LRRDMRVKRLGTCSNCRAEVVLAKDGVNGFRFCRGCERRGPDVMLESEIYVELVAEPEELVMDDMTIVEEPPIALVERSRWRV
jgi:hypothetical protein